MKRKGSNKAELKKPSANELKAIANRLKLEDTYETETRRQRAVRMLELLFPQ